MFPSRSARITANKIGRPDMVNSIVAFTYKPKTAIDQKNNDAEEVDAVLDVLHKGLEHMSSKRG